MPHLHGVSSSVVKPILSPSLTRLLGGFRFLDSDQQAQHLQN